MRRFRKRRVFRTSYGYDLPLIPRRIGMYLKIADGLGSRKYLENFYRYPNRLFFSRHGCSDDSRAASQG